jgi:uncharacterized membrane protein YgcG
MKKYFIFILVLVSLFGFSANAQDVASSNQEPTVEASQAIEQINSMDVEAKINQDGSVNVIETIHYNFGDQEKHGIYRTIPLGFKPKGNLGHTEIKVNSVTDELGYPYSYIITSDDPLNIKIGDADTLIKGAHFYKIYYDLSNSIGFFDNFDEWYWNLSGDKWEIPVKNISAKVILPTEVNEADLKLKDYCGISGSTYSCGDFSYIDSRTILYKTKSENVFQAGEGATIAVGFPKGLVFGPTKMEIFMHRLSRLWFWPVPFIIGYFWFRKKIKYIINRNKFFKKNPIVAEYDAGMFNPLEVGLLVNKEFRNKDISAVIVSLAIAGYIKIENKDGEFCFKKIKDVPADMTSSEKLVYETVGDICESSFGDKEAVKFIKVESQSNSRLIARDYIENKNVSKFKYNGVGIPLFLALNPGIFFWLIGYFFLGGIWAGFIFSGTCVLIAVLNIFLKTGSVCLTDKGFEAERMLLGLKLYLKVAEEARINFANAPAKTPELFEKLLPYAMVFGLEKKWAIEFKDIYTVNPTWYTSPYMSTFSTLAFIGSIKSMQSSTDNAIVSSVQSSSSSSWSSSSGGSSGGGSSGGGGGGGGGGSW